MSGITLLDTESKSDHIPIMVTLNAQTTMKSLEEPREVISKEATNDELIKALLEDSDWPRIPFNKCWNIKKFLYAPKKGRQAN